MLNLEKHPPYHPDPGEEDRMKVDSDPCESSSLVLNDEEVAFGEKHGVFPEHTDFIIVNRVASQWLVHSLHSSHSPHLY